MRTIRTVLLAAIIISTVACGTTHHESPDAKYLREARKAVPSMKDKSLVQFGNEFCKMRTKQGMTHTEVEEAVAAQMAYGSSDASLSTKEALIAKLGKLLRLAELDLCPSS